MLHFRPPIFFIISILWWRRKSGVENVSEMVSVMCRNHIGLSFMVCRGSDCEGGEARVGSSALLVLPFLFYATSYNNNQPCWW